MIMVLYPSYSYEVLQTDLEVILRMIQAPSVLHVVVGK